MSLANNSTDLCPGRYTISVRPMTAGPLFLCEDVSFLTKNTFLLKMHTALVAVGIDPTGHSFRIEAATGGGSRNSGLNSSDVRRMVQLQ